MEPMKQKKEDFFSLNLNISNNITTLLNDKKESLKCPTEEMQRETVKSKDDQDLISRKPYSLVKDGFPCNSLFQNLLQSKSVPNENNGLNPIIDQLLSSQLIFNKTFLCLEAFKNFNRSEKNENPLINQMPDKNLPTMRENNEILNLLNVCLQHIPLPPVGSGTHDTLHILYNHTMFQALNFQKCVSKYLNQLILKNNHENVSTGQLRDQRRNGTDATPMFIAPENQIPKTEQSLASIVNLPGNFSHLFLSSLNKDLETNDTPVANENQNGFAIDLSMHPNHQKSLNVHGFKTTETFNCPPFDTSFPEIGFPVKYFSNSQDFLNNQNGLSYITKDTTIENRRSGFQHKNYLSSFEKELFSRFSNRNFSHNTANKGHYSTAYGRLSKFSLLKNKKSKCMKGGISNMFQKPIGQLEANETMLYVKKTSFRGTSEEENEVCPHFKPIEKDGQVILSDLHPSVMLHKDIYQSLLIKSSASATRLIRLLMKSFFTQEELAASSLSGEGIYKQRLQPDITEAIKAFIRKRHPQLKTGSINLCMTDVCVQARRVANNQRSRVRSVPLTTKSPKFEPPQKINSSGPDSFWGSGMDMSATPLQFASTKICHPNQNTTSLSFGADCLVSSPPPLATSPTSFFSSISFKDTSPLSASSQQSTSLHDDLERPLTID